MKQKNLIWIADLEKTEIGPGIEWKKIINDFEAEYHV